MSFGEGNKREAIEHLKAENAQLRRSLGGAHAACNRLQGENRTLRSRVDRLEEANGALCAEVNRQERVIEALRAEVGR